MLVLLASRRVLLALVVALTSIDFLYSNMRLIVVSVVPARSLDDRFRPINPTTTFGPQDTFFVSVKLENYRSEDRLIERWRYEGKIVAETTLLTSTQGSGYAGFTLSRQDEASAFGRYTVQIIHAGEIFGVSTFSVSP